MLNSVYVRSLRSSTALINHGYNMQHISSLVDTPVIYYTRHFAMLPSRGIDTSYQNSFLSSGILNNSTFSDSNLHNTMSRKMSTNTDDVVRIPVTEVYDFTNVEKKWRNMWEVDMQSTYSNPDGKVPSVDVTGSCIDESRPSFYSLSMFPYPSGNLHMGHVRVYTLSDTLSRFYAYKGYNVLHPMGWDAFGLPAENAAIERNVSPSDWTYRNIKHMRTQLDTLGFKFNWEREIATCHEDYYKWTQWMFTQLYRAGFAYRKHATVNWDPIDQTVLANEQVDAQGKSWRSGAVVERKELNQWFFKTTALGDELLEGLDQLPEWPNLVQSMQRTWIGKRNSAHVYFTPSKSQEGFELDMKSISAFTTRPDTIAGVTYVGILPSSSIASDIINQLETLVTENNGQVTINNIVITSADIETYRTFIDGYSARRTEHKAATPVSQSKYATAVDPIKDAITTGVLLPFTVTNPITHKSVSLYLADYIEEGRGTGVVMGVPAHDNNDCAFALKHDIPIRPVVVLNEKAKKKFPDTVDENGYILKREGYTPFTSRQGIIINSQLNDQVSLDNMTVEKAALTTIDLLTTTSNGESSPSYALHDWLVSRQRYWGTPIPIIHCSNGCGIQPVPEADLPVKLPSDIPLSGRGPSPLASDHPSAIAWRSCKCPSCGNEATRETDTLDTFIDSSWYFLRYLASPNHRSVEKLAPIPLKVKVDENNHTVPTGNTETVDPSTLPWDMTEQNHMYPVTQYIGGIEHAILHLLYARFFGHFLHQQGLTQKPEPFTSLLTQGMVHGESFKDPESGKFVIRQNVNIRKDGTNTRAFVRNSDGSDGKELNVVWEKMSKSKYNGVDPDDMVAKYGADVCRMFMLFKAPPEKVLDWDERAVMGNVRWLNRINSLVKGYCVAVSNAYHPTLPVNYDDQPLFSLRKKEDIKEDEVNEAETALLSVLSDTVQSVSREFESRQFNVAIAKLMTLTNSMFDFMELSSESENTMEWNFPTKKLLSPVFRDSLLTLSRLLASISPHFAAESFESVQCAYYGIKPEQLRVAFGPHFNKFGKSIIGNINGVEINSNMFDVHAQKWPTMDSSYIIVNATTVVSVNGKVLEVLNVGNDIINAQDVQSAIQTYPPFLKLVAEKVGVEYKEDMTWTDLNITPKRIICKVTKPGEASMINIVL